MKFSLVMGSLGRTDEVRRMLTSLEHQSLQDFEVILVDQNIDDRLMPLVASSKLRITHIRTTQPGLSRARNLGLAVATGEYIAFPDDDCWYPDTLLADVAQWFSLHPHLDGVTGQCRDEDGVLSQLPWSKHSTPINSFNVWRQAISFTVFLRRHVVTAVGTFDEALGVGAGTPWGSGEETDYLLRAMAAHFHLVYEPSIVVFHPETPEIYDAKLFSRGVTYGAGMGRVLRKHRAPVWQMLYMLVRAMMGVGLGLICLAPAKSRFHWNVLKGRLIGMLSTHQDAS